MKKKQLITDSGGWKRIKNKNKRGSLGAFQMTRFGKRLKNRF